MVCEAQFLLDFALEAKKRGHQIYEIVRSREFVENVAKLSRLYVDPTEEVKAIAIRRNPSAVTSIRPPSIHFFAEKSKRKAKQ